MNKPVHSIPYKAALVIVGAKRGKGIARPDKQ